MNENQKTLLALLVIIGALATFVVLPVLEYVLLSIVLAYVLFPLHKRLRTVIGSMGSAVVLIAGALVAIIVPVVYILSVFARDLRAAAEGETVIQINVVEDRIYELTGEEIEFFPSVEAFANRLVGILFGDVTGVLSTALEFFIGIALILFLVFYLLRDGEAFVDWLAGLSPLMSKDTERLFSKVNQTMWGAVIGHSFAAFVQAMVAGVGLWIAGIDNVIFWTVVMAVLAFLPLIGAFLVWAPAAVYLFLLDQTVAAAFLFIYGVSIVSMIDYYARPLVIDQSARLNPGVILVGVFGGIYSFGFVGLFVGPIIIGVLAATLEAIREEQQSTAIASNDASTGEPATRTPPPERQQPDAVPEASPTEEG